MPEVIKENLVDIYFKKLIVNDEPNPGKILSQFFWELFSITPRVPDIILFNKLVKLFGREIMFEVIVDVFGMDVNMDKSLYPLFLAMAKRKFEATLVNRTYDDLSEYFDNVKKKVEEIKKANGK